MVRPMGKGRGISWLYVPHTTISSSIGISSPKSAQGPIERLGTLTHNEIEVLDAEAGRLECWRQICLRTADAHLR